MSDTTSESHNFELLSEDDINKLDIPEDADDEIMSYVDTLSEDEKKKKEDEAEKLEDTKRKPPDSVAVTPELLMEIAEDFIRHFKKKITVRSPENEDETEEVEVELYMRRIAVEVAKKKKPLLFINFAHILEYRQSVIDKSAVDILIYHITNNPARVREYFIEIVKRIFKEKFEDIPLTSSINDTYNKIQVGFTNFQEKPTPLNDLRTQHLGKYGMIEGVISQFDEQPRFKVLESVWLCAECQTEYKVMGSKKPTVCYRNKDCSSKSFVEDIHRQRNEDFLDIRLTQQYSGMQKNNTVDRYVKLSRAALVDHTLNNISPGQVVVINGVYVPSEKTKSRNEDESLEIEIDGFTIEQKNNINLFDYNERLLSIVKDYINEKNVHRHVEKLRRSVCSHLYGQEWIKFAVLLMMVGTNPRRRPDGTREKGDINVLNCGNSGTGKSDYATYIQNVIPHSIKAGTRGGTSVAGLTTFIDRNPKTGKSVVSLGVLAMVDRKGVALIEEINRRNKKDLDEFATATDDNQEILVNKGGFHSIIHSRCPIYATANSLENNGIWDDTETISKQTNIDSFILQRMDLIFVSHMDRTKEYKDKLMAHIQEDFEKSVLEKDYEQQVESKNSVEYIESILKDVEVKLRQDDFSGIYPVEYMRHEIYYLKSIDCRLKTKSEAYAILDRYYKEYSSQGTQKQKTLGITDEIVRMNDEIMNPRKFTTLRKIAEAIGRLHRSPVVTKEHAQMTIELMSISLASQIPNSSELSQEEQDEYVRKMMDKATSKSIVSQMSYQREQKRNRYFAAYSKLLNIFNKTLYKQGYDMCKMCHGTGAQSEIVDSDTKQIETNTCADCDGQGGFYQGFTKYDLEANVLNTGMMDEQKFNTFWKLYESKKFVRFENSRFFLKKDLRSPEVVDSIRKIAEKFADDHIEADERKLALDRQNSQRPLFKRGDDIV